MNGEIRYVGKRSIIDEWSSQVSCPAGYQYFTPIGQHLETKFRDRIIAGNYLGAYSAGAGLDHTEVGTDQDVFEGDTNFTAITPVKFKNAKHTITMRNNGDTVVDANIYLIKPRGVAIENEGMVNITYSSNWQLMFNQVLEGIYDRYGSAALNTSFIASVHRDATGVTVAQSLDGTPMPEMSLKVPVTVFDSEMFTTNFEVLKVFPFKRMKPGDEAMFTIRHPDFFMPEGVEVFETGTTISLYDFERYIMVGLQGHIGHEGTVGTGTPVPGVPTAADRDNCVKQSVNNVNFAKGQLDIMVYRQMDLEVYEGKLWEPATGYIVDTENDGNDYNDTIIQTVHDIN